MRGLLASIDLLARLALAYLGVYLAHRLWSAFPYWPVRAAFVVAGYAIVAGKWRESVGAARLRPSTSSEPQKRPLA